MLILDFRTGKMTKLALDLIDVASVVGPGAALGLGGAGLGYLIDMLAGTKRRWTTILGLTGLAGGAGVGGWLRYMYKQQLRFPEKVGDVTSYADKFIEIASKRLPEDQLQQNGTQRNDIGKMEGTILFDQLAVPGLSPNSILASKPNPYSHSAFASLIPLNDRRQIAIRHAAYTNLEAVPLHLCWNELDADQRDQLFKYFRTYRDWLSLAADNPAIDPEAENAFSTVVQLLVRYGKGEHAKTLQELHGKHKANVQELAKQIQ